MSGARGQKNDERLPADDGEYWRCTLLETATRLRVGRGIGQNETEAARELWEQVKQRTAHQDSPPPFVSDGWGGHREALLEVYGQVPARAAGGHQRANSPAQTGTTPRWSSSAMAKVTWKTW